MKDHTIKLNDGRNLGYMEYGCQSGVPFLLFHGTPGSRKWFTRDEPIFEKYNIRVITPERPGYGNSDFLKNRNLLGWSNDVSELMDKLEIERAHIVGVSGGGAYALGCASQIPERVVSATLVSSVAPPGIEGYTEEMAGGNKFIFFLVNKLPILARLLLLMSARAFRKYPDKVLAQIESQLCESDIRVLRESTGKDIENSFAMHTQEAYKTGVNGALSDLKLVSNSWDINFADINVPILLWHGESDTLSPIAGGKYLSQVIPNIEANFIPDAGHFLLEDDKVCNEIIQKALRFDV